MFAAAVGLLTAAAGRFMLPNAAAESTERFRAGRPNELPPGYVETKYKQRHGAWLVHGTYNDQQQIYALSTRCTHLGCITIWQDTEQKFACPCHGSGFNKLGENIEGPAPAPSNASPSASPPTVNSKWTPAACSARTSASGPTRRAL